MSDGAKNMTRNRGSPRSSREEKSPLKSGKAVAHSNGSPTKKGDKAPLGKQNECCGGPGSQGVEDLNKDSLQVKRKTQAEKEQNSHQRHQQIQFYNSLVAKEERRKRFENRRGTTDDDYEILLRSSSPILIDEFESPKKKKRVSFES